MKVAIMQPYLFPYLGYYSLVASVEKFVFYDDVGFIKNGWINRNRLHLSGDVRYFTVPLVGASSNLKIRDIHIQPRSLWLRKLLDSIRQSYSKAPHFSSTFELVRDVLDCDQDSISEIAKRSIVKVSEALGLDVMFVMSSADYGNEALTGQDRVIDICCREMASQYFNLPGGRDLYHESKFREKGIDLNFISPQLVPYPQFQRPFSAGLSIIDVMMFNSVNDIRKSLVF